MRNPRYGREWLIDPSIQKLFIEYGTKIAAITQQCNQLLATFVTKIPFQDHVQRNYELRDSILYRLESLVFHFHWMIEIQTRIAERAAQGLSNRKPLDERSFLYAAEQNTMFIFDNVVFNVISLFDYLGNLIGNTYQRERIRKWPGICNAARGSSPFSKREIAKLVIKINKEWVDPLYKYRSDLIHGEKAHTETDQTFKINPGRQEVHVLVKVPPRFYKIVKAYTVDFKDPSKTHILDAVEWLTSRAMDATLELISKMHRDFSAAGTAHNSQ